MEYHFSAIPSTTLPIVAALDGYGYANHDSNENMTGIFDRLTRGFFDVCDDFFGYFFLRGFDDNETKYFHRHESYLHPLDD